MPMPDSESVFVIPGSVLLWRIAPRPPNSAQVSLGPVEAASLFLSAPLLLLPGICGASKIKCPSLRFSAFALSLPPSWRLAREMG